MDGILPLYKPKGYTSHDCVYALRKKTSIKKVGHTGTLDPSAEGVLPICLGKATKVAQYMSDDPKTYEAKITLGTATTTEDQDGEVVEQKSVEKTLHRSDILQVLKNFTGTLTQIPPMYSAVKVKGKKLYEYAREGRSVQRPERTVNIFILELLDHFNELTGKEASFTIRVHCSKGTYIRTLAVDIGRVLGYPAHLSALLRTASGSFQLTDCLTFAEVEQQIATGMLKSHLMPLEKALSFFKKVTVEKEIAQQISHGQVLPLFKGIEEKRFSIYNEEDQCLAIYQQHPTKPGMMKPEKVFNS